MLSKLRRSCEQKENRAQNGVTQELLLSLPKFYGKLVKEQYKMYSNNNS